MRMATYGPLISGLPGNRRDRPVRSYITIMSLLMGQSSRVSRNSFALQSGRLFMPSSITPFQEVGDGILLLAAVP